MAITPTEFFSRNCKWFLLVFVILFLFKSVQSCNRNMRLNITSGDYIHTIDSLKKDYSNLERVYKDTVDKLNFELRLAKEKEDAAVERASAVQNAVEKIKSNTTINVRGAEEVKDISKNK